MFTKRFLISWIVSALVMFGASYVWHGIILTDFSRLSYPKEIFLVAASLVYLLIGFLLNKAYEAPYLEKYKTKPVAKGAIVGSAVGFMCFLVSMVVGISFSTGLNLENLVLDISWQMIEQCIGGCVIGLVHIFVHAPFYDID